MEKNNIETVTMTLDKYDSLMKLVRDNNEKVKELANTKVEAFKKDLEVKLGLSIEHINKVYDKTHKTLSDTFVSYNRRIKDLEERLDKANKELSNTDDALSDICDKHKKLCEEHTALQNQYKMLEQKYQKCKEDYNKFAKRKWFNFNWLK